MALNPLKFFWNVMTLKAKLVAIGVFLLLILVAFGGYKACKWLNPPPKLDEKQIKKAEVAIATEDRKVMVEVLAESDTKDKEIDSNIKQIEQNREDAKKNYDGLSNDQLADELNKRAQQP